MRRRRALALVFLFGCGSTAATPDAGTTSTTTTDGSTSSGDDARSTTGDGAAANASPLTSLPVGDGKYVAYPKSGYVFSCQTSFGAGAGGAFKDGPWIKGDGTFDFTAKTVVQGDVSWPSHLFDVVVSSANRAITGNALPSHTTGVYPIASTDPAYAYDRNPNSIAAQSLSWSVPANPTEASVASCLPMGPIGVLLTGAAIFNALDGEGRDAVAHETQDHCQAHPERSGQYHYHSVSTCIDDPGTSHSALLGYAKDGFGIYGVRGESGQVLTNLDLDECHGHSHSIPWDGQTVTMYHYHATYEYPYSLGCYKGTPIN